MTSNFSRSFKRGTKARKKRGEIAEAIKRERAPVRSPFAVATATVKRMSPKGLRPKGLRKLDPWTDPRFARSFATKATILYMTREEIERQHRTGEISEPDYAKYWKNLKSGALIEVALQDVPKRVFDWIKLAYHAGGAMYQRGGYAIRCGGANQHEDPLNVFLLAWEW